MNKNLSSDITTKRYVWKLPTKYIAKPLILHSIIFSIVLSICRKAAYLLSTSK